MNFLLHIRQILLEDLEDELMQPVLCVLLLTVQNHKKVISVGNHYYL